MTPEQIAAIEERARAATPGPWTLCDAPWMGLQFGVCAATQVVAVAKEFEFDIDRKNADHIAGLDPQTVLALCEAARMAERYRVLLDRLVRDPWDNDRRDAARAALAEVSE